MRKFKCIRGIQPSAVNVYSFRFYSKQPDQTSKPCKQDQTNGSNETNTTTDSTSGITNNITTDTTYDVTNFGSKMINFRQASEETANDIRELFVEMKRRRYNVNRFKIGLGVVATGLIFAFYEAITDFLSNRANDVTHKSLEDPKFIEDATVFGTTVGKKIIKNLSEDSDVHKLFSEFFKELFTSQPIIDAAEDLAKTVVDKILNDEQHQQIRDDATKLAKKRIIEIYQDPEIVNETSLFMWKTFKQTVWGTSNKQ